MESSRNKSQKEIALAKKRFLRGEIGVIPTDTIYGVAASALSKSAVSKSYHILKRNRQKPFIILIGSIEDLRIFNVPLNKKFRTVLEKIWPGKVSVVLPVPSPRFRFLHRGKKTLAFRLPRKKILVDLLHKTGPLISTSANPEGKKPAETIVEAEKYFGNSVDFYLNCGKMRSLPSTLVEINEDSLRILREGSGKIPRNLIN
jgi:L-threonylcarbamoyladenylate synthase